MYKIRNKSHFVFLSLKKYRIKLEQNRFKEGPESHIISSSTFSIQITGYVIVHVANWKLTLFGFQRAV